MADAKNCQAEFEKEQLRLSKEAYKKEKALKEKQRLDEERRIFPTILLRSTNWLALVLELIETYQMYSYLVTPAISSSKMVYA